MSFSDFVQRLASDAVVQGRTSLAPFASAVTMVVVARRTSITTHSASSKRGGSKRGVKTTSIFILYVKNGHELSSGGNSISYSATET
jgi:hypothetical protein